MPHEHSLKGHSILTDPDLRDGHPDLLDGGKVFIEAAALVVLCTVTLRVLVSQTRLQGAFLSLQYRPVDGRRAHRTAHDGKL